MRRKIFGHLICSHKTENKYLLLYRATNKFLDARKVPAVSKTEFTDMLVDSISVEHLADKVMRPLLKRGRGRPDKLGDIARRYKLVKRADGERYFERVPAKRRK